MAALLDVVMCGSQARNFWAPLRPEIRFSRRMPPADFRPARGLRSWRGQLFGKGIAFNLILRTTRAGIGGCRINGGLSAGTIGTDSAQRLCPNSVQQLKPSPLRRTTAGLQARS